MTCSRFLLSALCEVKITVKEMWECNFAAMQPIISLTRKTKKQSNKQRYSSLTATLTYLKEDERHKRHEQINKMKQMTNL